jgi:hypothetical protein
LDEPSTRAWADARGLVADKGTDMKSCRLWIVVVSIALLGCGGRTELSTSASNECNGNWTAAGPATIVSEPEDLNDLVFTSVIPSAGGALLAWSSWSAETEAPPSALNTRALNFDATPRSAITVHEFGAMSLAANGHTFVGLVNPGCRLLPLEQDGAETGPPVSLASLPGYCGGLAAAGHGFSFLTADNAANNAPVPFVLESIGLDGEPQESRVLGTPPLPGQRNLSGRIALRDQSFILATRSLTSGKLGPEQLQHFATDGTPLASALTRPEAQPVEDWVETKTGGLATWFGLNPAVPSGFSIFVQPLDDDGSPTAPPAPVPGPFDTAVLSDPSTCDGGSCPLMNTLWAAAPAPNGDVVLGMSASINGRPDGYHLHVMALGPDGSPRGPATDLPGAFSMQEKIGILVSDDGRRALLIINGSPDGLTGRVIAMPLVCAP